MIDGRNGLPLYFALRNETNPVHVVQFLVHQWPESLRMPLYEDRLALHLLCESYTPSFPMIRFVAEQWPDALGIKGAGELPLHYASGNPNVGSDTIAFLLDAWPDSIRVRDKYGRIPLHAACGTHDVKHEVITLLMTKWPDALQSPSSYQGDLPLHLACRIQSPQEVLQSLVSACPETLCIPNHHGEVPLHLACLQPSRSHYGRCRGERSLNKIRFLVESCPASLRIQTKEGLLPLHYACRDSSTPEEILEYLIQQFPEAIRVPTFTQGALPLHLACARKSKPRFLTIDCLVRAWPESVMVECDQEYRCIHHGCRVLPLDVVCAEPLTPRPTVETIRALTPPHMSPIHFACSHASSICRTCWIQTRLQTLRCLAYYFRASEDWTQFHQGMLPLHGACRGGAPRPILEWCFRQSKDAFCTLTTDTGDSPVHCYLSSWRAPMASTNATHLDERPSPDPHDVFGSAVDYLLEQYPEAVHISNRSGLLPFHVAILHKVPLGVLFTLAQCNPEALLPSPL